MAAFVKFNQFMTDLMNKVHDLLGTGGSTADVLKVMLTNSAPNVATNAVKADLTDLSTANGYTAGGASASLVGSVTSGTFSAVGTDITFTAAGGTIGPFRYAVLYNDTPTSPADPLIGYWDYGSAITLADTESIKVDFGSTMFTLA